MKGWLSNRTFSLFFSGILTLQFAHLHAQNVLCDSLVNQIGVAAFKILCKENPYDNVVVGPLGLALSYGAYFQSLTDQQTTKFFENNFAELSEPHVFRQLMKMKSEAIRNDDTIQSGISHISFLVKRFVEDAIVSPHFDCSDTMVNVSFETPAALHHELNKYLPVQHHHNGSVKVVDSDSSAAININFNDFSGLWQRGFDISAEEDFFYAPENRFKITYMNVAGRFRISGNDSFEALVIPYMDPNYCLIVYKPSLRNSLQQMIEKISLEHLLLPLTKKRAMYFGNIQLPKISINYAFNFNSILRQISTAGHTQESRQQPSIQSEVKQIQSSSIIFHHAGGKVGDIFDKPTTRELNSFLVNRPFLYTIVNEKTSSIIYIGSVSQPTD